MPVSLMLKFCAYCLSHPCAPIDLLPHLLTLKMIFGWGNGQIMKENMSLGNLGIDAFHATKVPTHMFSSTLICLLTLDYNQSK